MALQYVQYPAPTTTQAANTNGLTVLVSATTTAQNVVPPANSVGFILESDSLTANNVRWAIGAAATPTLGMLCEPGRDSGYVPASKTISVIALSATQPVNITWVMSS